jgi:hypothetical protein
VTSDAPGEDRETAGGPEPGESATDLGPGESADTPPTEAPDGSAFDQRWEELSQELGDSLPQDLQDWAKASGPPAPRNRGHVVWGADPAALESDGAGVSPPPPPGPRDWAPPDEDDHFEPPDPPPILAGDPVVVVAWVALLGGILTVLAWAVLGGRIPVSWARAGLVVLLVGAGVLISRLPRRRPPDEDLYGPDDG